MSSIPSPPGAARPDRRPEVDPIGLLILLGREKRTVAVVLLASALVAVIISLLIPRFYTGVTRILPPQEGQGAAEAMLGRLSGGLTGLPGRSLGGETISGLYVGLLQSDAVADALIERFKLQALYGAKSPDEARRKLAGDSRFVVDRNGFTIVEVDARDPRLAASLANAYVEELHRLSSTMARADAAQQRVFFERQLLQAKEKLAEAEQKLRQGIESGGLVSMGAQSKAWVENQARLRAQVGATQIQIGAMNSYAAPSHPDLQRAERELSAMQQELSRLESGGPGDAAGGDARGLGTFNLVREVKYRELLFQLLARQYELARVNEAKEAPAIQVMDRADPPEKRSGPTLALLLVAATAFGFLGSVVYVLSRNDLQAARQDPAQRSRLEALAAAWSRRRG